ncbi:MAG: DUF4912 domain-containing protein [Candidatus Omnitrophica bacterium]|nr:DUF4912 domain-containing protein [Candidatus Omnitrophota bacterium]
MARKGSSSSSKPLKRRAARLAALVSSLTAGAADATRKVVRGRKAPSKPAGGATAQAAPAAPIPRASVVRKPSRNPTIARRKAAAGKSPVRKPGRRAGDAASSPLPVSSASTTPAAPWEPAQPASAPHHSRTPQEPPSPSAGETPYAIPSGYGDDRIVLMVKDPWWLYAYWEIQPETERAARGRLLPHEIAGLRSVLRVYDVTGRDSPAEPVHRAFDIALSGLATNWFIQTDAPNREFIVDIGLLANTGRFLLLARSNRVTTPRTTPSEVIDEDWMVTDEAYWKLFGLSGLGSGSSPSWSGSVSSFSVVGTTRPSIVRGFWCRVNADLVIHGATEPRSTVAIQGQPVAVRRDGSFSLRLTLPVGTQTVAIDITSPDGRHTKTVTPVVTLAWSGALSADAASTETPRARTHARPSGDNG